MLHRKETTVTVFETVATWWRPRPVTPPVFRSSMISIDPDWNMTFPHDRWDVVGEQYHLELDWSQ